MIITLNFVKILGRFDDVSEKAIELNFLMCGLRKGLSYNIKNSLSLELWSTLVELFECFADDLAIGWFKHNNKIKKNHHNIKKTNQQIKIFNNFVKF